MSAQTGHNPQTARWKALVRSGRQLLGKRDNYMTERMLLALQLYKNNELGLVFVQSECDPLHLLEDTQMMVLSIPIINLGFTPQTEKFCRERGIELLGEVYKLNLLKAMHGGIYVECRDEVKYQITQSQLPFGLDLDSCGWIPPYASDPAVLALWNMPVETVLKSPNEHGKYSGALSEEDVRQPGIVFVGDLLRRATGRLLRDVQQSLRKPTLLRAGMFVPKTWQRPEQPNKEGGCSWQSE